MILFNTVSKMHKCHQDQGVTQPQEHHLSLGASLWLQEFPSTGIPLSSLWPVSCMLGRAQRREEISTEAMPWLQKAETFLIRLPLTPHPALPPAVTSRPRSRAELPPGSRDDPVRLHRGSAGTSLRRSGIPAPPGVYSRV